MFKPCIYNIISLEAPLDVWMFCYIAPANKKLIFVILGGAEIISMDAFNKSTINNEVVIGITIIKVTTLYQNNYIFPF